MGLDPGPLVALVAGGAMGALMRWAGPHTRAWRVRLEARPALRRAALLGAGLAGLGLAWLAVAEPDLPWLRDGLAWARQEAPSPFGACGQPDGADRPAVAVLRRAGAMAACL